MKKFYLAAFAITSALTAADANFPGSETPQATQNPPANQADIDSFYQTLQAEIQKQAQFVNSLANQAASKSTITSDAMVARFENANAMLNVKKTLYANFYNTPSINSPLVRQKLVQLFKQEMITAADLSQLQAIVDQERPKWVPQK